MSDELLREATRNHAEAIAAKDAEIERLRTDLELDKYAIGHYKDQIAKLQAVVDAINSLTLYHETDCSSIQLADQATNRWWPECDCNISKLDEALAALETDDEQRQ